MYSLCSVIEFCFYLIWINFRWKLLPITMLKIILLIIFFDIKQNNAHNFNSLKDQNTLSSSVVSLIIKGDPVTSHVPYYARVRLDNIQGKFCGGVVVHQKWVITIAKCVNQVHQDVAGKFISDNYTRPRSHPGRCFTGKKRRYAANSRKNE